MTREEFEKAAKECVSCFIERNLWKLSQMKIQWKNDEFSIFYEPQEHDYYRELFNALMKMYDHLALNSMLDEPSKGELKLDNSFYFSYHPATDKDKAFLVIGHRDYYAVTIG